ncbi:MAG: molybdopterin molybdotransferase MoeA [Burkholderiaceae bacterium]
MSAPDDPVDGTRQAVPGDGLLRVDEARRLIVDSLSPSQALQRVDLRSALHRVLALDQVSPIDVPPADCAAMDGYAIRSADLATGPSPSDTVLSVVGSALAGRPYLAPLAPGQAVRVSTGALMPAGLDAIVLVEDARVQGNRLTIPADEAPPVGRHCRRAGEDLKRGRVVLRAGRVLRPADLGLLASIGIGEVPVHPPLRVAYFSTGDELRPLGLPLDLGQIYDSNRYSLFGMLHRLGVDLIDMGIVPDDPIALEATLRSAAERADVILSSGGMSVGEADFTREVMERLGEVLFWRIAIRPGKPLAFGRVGDAVYFGLPGNPVAAMTSFYFLVRPALHRMMGAAVGMPPSYVALATERLAKRPGRTEFQRGVFLRADDGRLHVRSTGDQGSAMLRSMSDANCIIVLEHERGPVEAGERVDILPFDGLL